MSNPGPITTSPQPGPATHVQQAPKKVSLGVRLLAMLIGTVIFAGLDYALGSILNQSIQSTSNPPLLSSIILSSSGVLAYITPYNLLGILIFTVPLFFGVEFGVLVGLVCVLAGSLTGDYFANHGFVLPWYLYLSNAVFCLIPSLAFTITRGRYNRTSAYVLVIILSLIGIVFSNIIWVVGNAITYHQAVMDAINTFLGISLSNLLCLVVLPILLLIYNAIFNRQRVA